MSHRSREPRARRIAAAALCFALFHCARGKPSREIWFNELRLNHCAPSADTLPIGHFTLWMVMLPDGTVPAAFVHDSIPAHSAESFDCFVSRALRVRVSPRAADTVKQTTLVCDEVTNPAAAGRRDGNKRYPTCSGIEDGSVEQPLDEALARDTLALADWAGPADAGWGMEYAGMHTAALAKFREALVLDREDPRALRGLAQSLISTGGDLDEARKAALEAVRIDPAAASTHEALLRVCLAAKDDECAIREQLATVHGVGSAERAWLVAPLDEQIQAAVDRVQDLAKAAEEGARLKKDPALAGGLEMAPLSPDEWVTLAPRNGSAPRRLNADVRGPDAMPASGSSAVADRRARLAALLPVLFLPGLGGGVRDFAPLLADLSTEHRAVALELPGEGFSDAPPGNNFTEAEIVRELAEAMDALEIPRAVIAGHGLGASIATAFASAHPERVAGLLLIDPLGDLTLADRDQVRAAVDAMSARDFLTTYDGYEHVLFSGSRESTRLLALREGHRLRRETAAGYFELAASLPVVSKLRALRMPVELVESSYDDEPFAIGIQIPSLPATITTQSSPWIMLDDPDAVNARLHALLAQVEPKP